MSSHTCIKWEKFIHSEVKLLIKIEDCCGYTVQARMSLGMEITSLVSTKTIRIDERYSVDDSLSQPN